MKQSSTDYDVVIVGGGLAGLISGLVLSRSGKKVLLVEKKSFPFNKVCGEYVSNEVFDFLCSLNFNPFSFGASRIQKLRVSSPSGKQIYAPLDLGGFGLSRYVMDEALLNLLKHSGVDVMESTKVNEILFEDDLFSTKFSSGEIIKSKFVIGSYGKRDTLDKKLNRKFIQQHTGFMGVKYHVKTDYPIDEVGLDNFENGYCGIVKIEDDKYNVCYLFKRTKAVEFASIRDLETLVLFKNPVIKEIFKNSDFIRQQPEVINEISFARKSVIENHILMCGDAAGLITPLCGNGMAMAIHSGKILAELMIESGLLMQDQISLTARELLESNYKIAWNKHFRTRLFAGRTIQRFFGNPMLTDVFLKGVHAIPSLETMLIKKTHGPIIIPS
ncbi:NAD(P)/FAD-dependent oxidoreductase [soil metagenome]